MGNLTIIKRILPILLGFTSFILVGCTNSNANKDGCRVDTDCQEGRLCVYGVCMWQEEAALTSQASNALARHMMLALKYNDASLLSGDLFDVTELARVFNLGSERNTMPVFVYYAHTFAEEFKQLATQQTYQTCTSARLRIGKPARMAIASGSALFVGSKVELQCDGAQVLIPIENLVWNGTRFVILTLVSKNLTGLE